MPKTKILIADNGMRFGVSLANFLKNREFYAITRPNNVKILIDSIKNDLPDVVILNENCLSCEISALINTINRLKNCPKIIAISENESLNSNEVSVFSSENATFEAIATEIERLLEVSNIYTDEEDLDEKITHLLWQMGVPENLKGYGYLKSAVCLAMDDEEMLRCITKVLYSKEAKCYETTEIRVERAIRNAINVTFSKGNLSDILQFLGKDLTCKKLKPTNGELIKFLTQTAKHNCIETNNKE